jgi:hypothetical protein
VHDAGGQKLKVLNAPGEVLDLPGENRSLNIAGHGKGLWSSQRISVKEMRDFCQGAR